MAAYPEARHVSARELAIARVSATNAGLRKRSSRCRHGASRPGRGIRGAQRYLEEALVGARERRPGASSRAGDQRRSLSCIAMEGDLRQAEPLTRKFCDSPGAGGSRKHPPLAAQNLAMCDQRRARQAPRQRNCFLACLAIAKELARSSWTTSVWTRSAGLAVLQYPTAAGAARFSPERGSPIAHKRRLHRDLR